MERAEVKEKIERAILQGKRTIVLDAPGGYGKSYIARKYCENSSYGEDGFVFANGDIRKQLKDLFQRYYPCENAHDDMQDGAFARFIYNKFDDSLKEKTTPILSWIITYDDVSKNKKEFTEFIRQFKYAPRSNAHGIVIITTQNCWGISNKDVAVVKVDSVEEETARAFLNETICGISKEDVDKLLVATGRIALPLSIAGASIVRLSNRDNVTITDCVTTFCNKVTSEDCIIPNDLDGYDNNLYSAIRVTVDNILLYENRSDIAYDLLMCSAMTAPVQFGRQTEFTRKLGISHWEQAHEAIAGWHLFETEDSFNMHPTTQDVLLYIDRDRDAATYYNRLCRVSKAFIELCGSDNSRNDGLITISAETSPNYSSEIESAKRIHGLLRAAANETIAASNPNYRSLCEYLYALSYGIAYYYYKVAKNYKISEQYYKYAYDATEAILNILPKDDTWLYRKTAQLKYRGVSLRGLDENEKSLKCLDDALQLYNSAGEMTDELFWHILAAEILYNRGLTKSDKGNHQDVLDDYNASIKIVNDHNIENVPVPQRLLGVYFRDTGRYDKAEQCFINSRIVDGSENNARCSSNLGLLYAMIKDWERSKHYSKQAIKEFEEIGITTEYSPLLNLELCYRSQHDSQRAKECLLIASKIIFGDTQDTYAQQIKAILDGRFENVALNGKRFDRDNIACMLLCVHCAEYLISFSTVEGTNNIIQILLDMAFEVRERGFRTLRGKLLELKGFSQDQINEKIKEYISGLKYNKLTCAVLMFALAKYYLNNSDVEYAYIFACAAFHLYDAYNYEYGREKTREFIDSLDIL